MRMPMTGKDETPGRWSAIFYCAGEWIALRIAKMSEPLLSFVAEHVGTETTEYTEECVVYLIGFGTGDPEAGGHAWNFSRSFDDDWGVCTVREIQRATIYGGIERFRLHRSGMECALEPQATEKVGFRELRVTFDLDEERWHELAATAKVVFRDCPCFTVEE